MTSYYCYILRCGDDSFYTGITNNLEKRLQAHSGGKGGAYTASHLPVRLVYSEEVGSKSAALRRELQIKALSHAEKRALIYVQEAQ